MSDLAWRLSRYLEHPVIDRTGIVGSFDFRIEYKSEEERLDIVAMIHYCAQELGLKLDRGRSPVETLVIERAEKPTAN